MALCEICMETWFELHSERYITTNCKGDVLGSWTCLKRAIFGNQNVKVGPFCNNEVKTVHSKIFHGGGGTWEGTAFS